MVNTRSRSLAGFSDGTRRTLLPFGTRRGPPNADGSYCAFISYRHQPADRRAAKWLHREIETYSVPEALRARLGRARLGRAFRDEEELKVTPHLGDDIVEALQRSQWLIVVCSTETPKSPWVSNEVEWFLANKGIERILLLLIEGTPASSFPAALQRREHELLAADLRPNADDSADLRQRLAKLRLFATMLDCDFDELRNREGERRRRRNAIVVAISITSALVLGAFALVADANRIEANRQEELAAQSEANALSELGSSAFVARNLLEAEDAFARALLQTDIASLRERLLEARTRELGLLWSAPPQNSGSFVAHVPETRIVLTVFPDNSVASIDLDSATVTKRLVAHDRRIVGLAVSSDGKRAATVDSGGSLVLFNPQTLDVLGREVLESSAVIWIGFRPDGTLVVVLQNNNLHSISPAATELSTSQTIDGAPISAAALEPTHDYIIVGRLDGVVSILSLPDLAPVQDIGYGDGPVGAVAIDPNGEIVAAWGQTARGDASSVRLFQTADGTPIPTPAMDFGFPSQNALRFLSDDQLAIGQIATGFVVWDIAKGEPTFQQEVGATLAFAFDELTKSLLAIGDRLTRWNLANGNELHFATGHLRSIQALAFTSDGTQIVSGGLDGEVFQWDAATGKRETELERAGGTLSGLIMTADDAYLLGCTWSGLVVWNMITERIVHRLGVGSGIGLSRCATFNQESSTFWTQMVPGMLVETDPATLDSLDSFSIPSGVSEIFSAGQPKDFILAAGPQLWRFGSDVSGGQPFAPDFGQDVSSISVSGDSEFVAAASFDTVRVWPMESPNSPLWSLTVEQVNAIELSPDGHRLAVATYDKVLLLDTYTGRVEAIIDPSPGYETHVTALAFSPNGWSVAIGLDGGALALWGFEKGTVSRTIRSPARHIADGYFGARSAISRDGRFLLLEDPNNELSLWDLQNMTEMGRKNFEEVHGIEPYGDGFVIGSATGVLRFITSDLTTYNEVAIGRGLVRVLAVEERDGLPRRLGLALGPSFGETTLAAVWTEVPEASVRELGTFTEYIMDMDFDPCGNRLAVGTYKTGAARVFDLASDAGTMDLLGHTGTVTGIAFSPECRWIATSARDDRIRVYHAEYNLEGARLEADFEGQRGKTDAFGGYVEDVAFAPTGDRLYSAAGDGAVRVWEVGTWSELYALRGFVDPWVQSLTLDRDGRWLHAFSGDKVARVWDLKVVEQIMLAPPSELLKDIQSRAGLENFRAHEFSVDLPAGLLDLLGQWAEVRFGL